MHSAVDTSRLSVRSAKPALIVTFWTAWFGCSNLSARTAKIALSAICSTPLAAVSGRMMANSSPPNREAMSAGAANHSFKRVSHNFQAIIPCEVARDVIELLEKIYVHQNEPERLLCTAGAINLAPEHLIETSAIW